MKILLVGNKTIWAIEKHYLQHLSSKKNITCEIFSSGDIFRKNYRSLFQKIRHKIWPAKLYREINEQLLKYCVDFQPEVVWVFKGMEILPETLKKIKQMNIFLVNYNPDHPFVFSSRGSGNSNVSKSIAVYNLHYSYHPNVIKQIKQQYNIPCKMLPFAFDHQNINYGFYPEKEVIEIAFIGNPDNIRKEIVTYIANNGYKINVFGHSWKKYISDNEKITVHDAIYQEELWYTLQKYRLQLNIFRPHNHNSHNMRTFEIPSVGGIMLAPESEQHLSFFTPNKEAFFYRDKEDLLKKIHIILNLPQDKAIEIRKAAFEKSKKNTYLNRTNEFLEALNEYKK